jgi:hypothetical protein
MRSLRRQSKFGYQWKNKVILHPERLDFRQRFMLSLAPTILGRAILKTYRRVTG